MKCGTEAEVLRIIALNRRQFGNVEIFLDVWINDAGRSSVRLGMNVVWLVARGIPLHLRSKALYRLVGESCGQFICSDESRRLDSVRINVKLLGECLDEIPLLHGHDIVPIKVETKLEALCRHEERRRVL
ncbi:hypothetical protein LINGRAHAP2_LOCUS5106 [Linum grandiflorum]